MNEKVASRGAKPDAVHLRGRVYLSLLGVFLVLTAVRGTELWWEREQALQTEQRRAENLANVLAQHLEGVFGAVESAFNQLAAQSERIGGPHAPPEAWSPLLEATLSALPAMASLNVIDADGIVIASTYETAIGESRRARYLTRRLETSPDSNFSIGQLALGRIADGLFIAAGRALRDAQGRMIGSFTGSLRTDHLRSFYRTIDLGEHGVIQLVHAESRLNFREPGVERPDDDTLAQQIFTNVGNGSAWATLRGPIESGGERYLTAWRSVSRSSLVIAVSLSEQDALAQWRGDVFLEGGTSVAMALMLAIAGVLITSSSRAQARTQVERDRADAALRTSQAQFQAIMDHTPLFVMVKGLDGRCTFSNRAADQARGAPALGKTVHEMFPPAMADEMAATDRQVINSKEPMQREWMTPDGRAMLSVKFPLLGATGEVEAVGTISTDITAQKQSETQLAHAQRMEAVGQLTGGVAHDFNNLLTAILLNADVLARQIESDSLRYLAEGMRLAAERGADLTRRLLAFGRRQVLLPQATDVAELLDGMETLMRRTLGEHIEIVVRSEADLWPAFVDPGQLESAIINLAVNARDAMTAGGRLTIETTNVELDESYAASHADVKPGQYVKLSVSDTGTGMATDVIERAFEPFFTTKDIGKGTGLGLSMVYGFVKQSEGHVHIHSEAGFGTVVSLYLPRSSAAASTAAQFEQLPQMASGSETILLVEDDPLVRAYSEEQLCTLGYDVVTAENAPGALRLVEQGYVPDLLFSDIVMPGGMSGLDLARHLRARWPGLKVLLTSGYAHGAVEEAANDPLLERYILAKPYRPGLLAARIREVLDEEPLAAVS